LRDEVADPLGKTEQGFDRATQPISADPAG